MVPVHLLHVSNLNGNSPLTYAEYVLLTIFQTIRAFIERNAIHSLHLQLKANIIRMSNYSDRKLFHNYIAIFSASCSMLECFQVRSCHEMDVTFFLRVR